MSKKKNHFVHLLKPIINKESKILILGSFPSVISRECSFYYANKNNRFWKVISSIYQEDTNTIDKKLDVIKKYRLSFYDVIEECDINLSSDASITNVIPADIKSLINGTSIYKIILNGKKAQELFYKYNKIPNVEIFCLPSTSSANAQISLSELIECYKKVLL